MENAVTHDTNVTEPERFKEALRRFDEENVRDPNIEIVDSQPWPREWIYARRLSEWVLKLCPNASEQLRLAARCQHICRWMIPRNSYPMDRPGYLRWRNDLKAFHARKAGEILREVGYAEEIILKVQELNLKKNFPRDAEARVLEDALCLVFLQYQFAALASRTNDEKMINALQKSWKKMTSAAQARASELPYSAHERDLLDRALAPGQTNA